MKWKDRADPGFYHKLSVGIGQLTDEEMLTAINEARYQVGIAPVSAEVATVVSRKVRINMVLDLMEATDFCEEEIDAYWIDLSGKWQIILG